MTRPGLLRAAAALCAGAVLLGAAGCTGGAKEPEKPRELEESRVGWQQGEIRPKAVENACTRVSDATLGLLDLGDPVETCTWKGGSLDDVQRYMRVGVVLEQPDELRMRTATEVAEEKFPELVVRSGVEMEDVLERPGVGDQAVTSTASRSNFLLVRQRNLTVRVETEVKVQVPDDYYEDRVPPKATVEAATLAAAEDVLAAAGVPLEPPVPEPERATGEVERAQPVCDGLRDEGARLVPGAEPVDRSPDGGARSNCYWGLVETWDITDLGVEVEAVAPSVLTGRTGVAEANERFTFWTEDDGAEPVGGLGDEAVVDAEADYLHVRAGNLLVTVRDIRKGVSRGQSLADMESVARTALAQYG